MDKPWRYSKCFGLLGISIHGKYRVATENTLFAMPETAIGLFPGKLSFYFDPFLFSIFFIYHFQFNVSDVGSMFWMSRLLQRPMANFLGLTGQRIKAADLIFSGLATHYIESKDLPDLEIALVDATNKRAVDSDVVASVLKSFHRTIPTRDSFLAQHSLIVDKTFSADKLEDIFDNLQKENSEFGEMTLAKIQNMSPTAMKLTLEGLKRGAKCNTIGEDLQMEYRMATACTISGSDFFEGVRAVLVDKDYKPQWNPDTLEGVTDDMIHAFFAPVENELLFFHPPSKL
jgi:enoyl-CoA hydratase/carnithine racemase